MAFLGSLFEPSGLTPHGFCLLWQPGLIWLHTVSDSAVAVAYFSIPVALSSLVRRRSDLDYGWIYLIFAAFILSCGVTHVMSIVTLWYPFYALEGVIKAVTAVLSLTAAIAIWQLMPRALALPSPTALQDANAMLSVRVAESEDAERRLRESEARQRNIFVKLPAALCSLRMDGTIIEASETMAELLGRTRAGMIGRNIVEFLPPGEWASRRDTLQMILRTGEVRRYEGQFITAEHEIIDVLMSARVERGKSDGQDDLLMVVTDVTARRKAEAALRESEERLRQSQKMEAIGKLTGGIAHDFNNMLTVIDGNLDRLQERLGDDAQGLHLLEQADLASRRASSLITQLLAFSRKQRLEPQGLDAHEVITAMQSLLLRIVGEQIVLTIEDGGPRGACLADRNQLEAGVVNLVINATQAIQDAAIAEGSIRIVVSNMSISAADDWRHGDGEPPAPGDYVRVAVSDNGTGMSEEVRSQALEPFFTTKPVGRGSGLGLSQTYGFVCQSDGAMRIDSAPGRGTMIELLLPRVTQPGAGDGGVLAGAACVRPPPGRSGGRTVLVVEDEPAVLEVAASTLGDSGYTVIRATDAISALRALDAAPDVSVVFTDIVMPGQSGVAMAAEMWAQRPGLPIVFASGYSEASLTRQLPAGAKFIKKPYKISAVIVMIEAALSGGRVADETVSQNASNAVRWRTDA